MNILVIGGGGREHALAAAYAKSKRVKKVYVAPGNGLMDFNSSKINIFPDIGVLDFEKILNLIKSKKIDLVDVAQDDPLAAGLVDLLEVEDIKAFGPSQQAAEIEWNKIWSRNFMEKYKLPTPHFRYFSNPGEAIKYVNAFEEQTLYIKAAGLAQGKGAIRAENKKQAKEAIVSMKQFGKSGKKFLVEQALAGEEFSLFAICDGKDFKILSYAQDHKTVFDGDVGANTGGMGCIAPTLAVTASMVHQIEKTILKPLMAGMQKEERPYKGILYLGGMKTSEGIKIIEFNARWGDPEAEVILPAIKTDYLTIIESVLSGKLKNLKVNMDNKVRISVAGCSKGYPGDYSKVKGKEIFGLEMVMKLPGITIFGAGIKREDRKFFAAGGRIFHLVAEGGNVMEAREKAYHAMSLIRIEDDNLHYRTDIGWRDLARLRETLRRVKKDKR